MEQRTLDAFLASARDGPAWAVEDAHVTHPRLRAGAIGARTYQLSIAERAVNESVLAVLPTGLGKTVIAVLAAAERLHREPDARVLVLAPTRPLVAQHARAFRDALALPSDAVVALTGDVDPRERARLFADARVIVATPHGLVNDVHAGRIALADVTLLVVDEAHRAVCDYPYVPLARAYLDARGEGRARVLALTASPGHAQSRVTDVRAALGDPVVVVREHADEDVHPFVKDTRLDVEFVHLPERMKRARDELESLFVERVKRLKGFIPRRNVDPRKLGKGALLETGEVIRKRLARAQGATKGYCFGALGHHAVAMQTAHALDVLETQGLHPFREHVERLAERADLSRAQKQFLADRRVHRALYVAKTAPVSHPKELALLDALEDQFEAKPESLVLVFTQYRATVRVLTERLRRAGFPTARFVGQASKGPHDEGLSQDAQQDALDRFACGSDRVLVATSVAEEGLHVPSVDLVVFYEPVPSEIRAIQRRGRTGRGHVGRVLVLVTDDTRDKWHFEREAVRESEMRRLVHALRAEGDASEA